MFEFSVQNDKGEILELTENPNYNVTQITGLTPAGCTINTAAVAGMDGETFNSARINKRNITITIIPEYPIEQNRNMLYRYFPEKKKIRLFYENDIRNVYIDGYVESMESDLFTKKQSYQISILCPNPFFVDTQETGVFSCVPEIRLLEFPYSAEDMEMSEIATGGFTLNNPGTVPSGALFHVSITAPTESLTIYTDSGFLGIKEHLQAFDNVYIRTTTKEKAIWLERGGTVTNLLPKRVSGMTWAQVEPGANHYRVEVDTPTGYIMDVTYRVLYEGV